MARHSALRATITRDKTTNFIPILNCSENLDDFQIATVSSSVEDKQSCWVVSEIRKPIDLSKQLFRFLCYQTPGGNKLTMCFTFHHVVADGASIHTLLTELVTLLTGGSLPVNPPQLTSYLTPFSLDAANSSATTDDGGATRNKTTKNERIRQKWVDMVGSAKHCTRLERKYSTRDTSSETLSEWVSVKCAPNLTEVITEIGKCFGVCPTVVMTTAYSLALKTFLGLQSREGLVIGCGFANRRRSQQNMFGHTVSLLPMHVDFSNVADLSGLFGRINEGWCLIMEGGASLLDLLPILPCLKTEPSSQGRNTTNTARGVGSTSSSSPLQTVFSFLPAPQTPLPKEFRLSDGTPVECQVGHPKSCDAQFDLFLEVRAPRSWTGDGCESSYLLTWEYRRNCLSRSDVALLHSLSVNFLLSLLKCCRGNTAISMEALLESVAGLVTREDFDIMGSSYTYTDRVARCVENDNKKKNHPPGLWVWPKVTPCDPTTDVAPPTKLPTLVRPPQHASIVQGLVLEKPEYVSFVQQFVKKAGEIPDQTAFRYGTQTLTYHEAAVMVEKLACVLINEGVTPGNHVGLVLPHSPMLYISLLAVLRCGAAYVPLALHNPEERILGLLRQADSKLIVTDTETLRKTLPNYGGKSVCVDDEKLQGFFARFDDVPPLPPISYSGDQPAYIIFTSGTTGAPKGVVITNDSLSHLLANYLLLVTPYDTAVTLAGCTVAWDGHVLDFLGPLLNGACLVVAATLDVCEGITHALMSPSAASVVTVPKSMRSIVVGGEAFTQACYENIKSIPKVIAAYGPTEATVFVSADYVVGADASPYLSNIGKPMPDCTLMVCDTEQVPVALGSEGELCVAGPLVSKIGYYKNAEKTREAFVRSPLSQYDTVYRTGDWTRMLPDGRIVYLGRTDDQVKLRGMRFQLLEVENKLRRHSQVKMAAVGVRNLGAPSAQLVAFVTPRSVDVHSLFEFARANLPSYMVPSSITALQEMPLKTEGKVDRIKLLNMTPPDAIDTVDANINDPETQVRETTANLTQMTEKLAEIFGRVLGQKSYSPTADFFTNGGQSLLLFRLLQMVKCELRCRVQLSDLLQNSTPLSLARALANSRGRESVDGEDRDEEKEERDSQVSGVCVSEQREAERLGVTEAGSIVRETDAEAMNLSMEEELKDLKINYGLVHSTTDTPADASVAAFDYLAPVPDTPFTDGLVQALQRLFTNGEKNVRKESQPVDELSRQLQVESGSLIPPQALVRYPDLQTLQRHLKLKKILSFFESARTPLLHLQPPTTSSSHHSLIFIHGGIIGWPLPYLSLARSLGQRSIVIQRCEGAPTSSFESMAAYYVDAILRAQPEGPYTLIGVCYGAMLVYEVARQLTDRGGKIELAVLLNHSPAIEKMPPLFTNEGEPLPNTFVDPILFYRKILGLPLQLEGVPNSREEKLEKRVKLVVQEILSSPDSAWVPFSTSELEGVYLGFLGRLRCAWRGYRPRPGADIGHCLLIRDHSHPLFHSRDYGLGSLLPAGGSSSRLSVLTTPRKMGLLSDPVTFEFVKTAIKLYLQ